MENYLSDPLILMLIGAISWFFKKKTDGYDDKHTQHFKSIGMLERYQMGIQRQVDEHEKTCRDRHARIEEMFAETRDDIKTLIRSNGHAPRRG